MADEVKETAGPRFEVRDIGPGFSSTHIWPGDRTHEARSTICNDDRVFHSGVLATDEVVKVTRGRLIVICLDPEEYTLYELESGGEDTEAELKKGHRYRLVAVGLTQYHCEYGPEEVDEETADEVPAPASQPSADAPGASPSASAPPPKTATSRPPAPGLPPARGGLGLPGSDPDAPESGGEDSPRTVSPGEGGSPL